MFETETPATEPLKPIIFTPELAKRSRFSPTNIFRSVTALVFAGVFAGFGPHLLSALYAAMNRGSDINYTGAYSPITLGGLTILGAFFGAGVASVLSLLGKKWERTDGGDKVSVSIGAFAGLICTIPFLLFLYALPISPPFLLLLIVGLLIGFASVAVYALQSMADVLPWYKNRVASKRSGIKILDTNVIIDGRIYDVVKSGFVEGEIYVPQFVLEELQHIADNHDPLRRQRGRRGLEVLKHLQAEGLLEVGKYDKYASDPSEEVDSRLVRIAKAVGADLVTNDWNLNSVAKLQHVRILSLNQLALTLRTNILPSETLSMSIIREGSQYGQGVGYLDDGTMVVIENGKAFIGETRPVTVTQVIQTERGKLIFARVEN